MTAGRLTRRGAEVGDVDLVAPARTARRSCCRAAPVRARGPGRILAPKPSAASIVVRAGDGRTGIRRRAAHHGRRGVCRWACCSAPAARRGRPGARAAPAARQAAARGLGSSGRSDPAAADLLVVGDIGDCGAGGDRGRRERTRWPRPCPDRSCCSATSPTRTAPRPTTDACFWPPGSRSLPGPRRSSAITTPAPVGLLPQWRNSGTSRRPWYSYRSAAWRVLVVDANCTAVSCAPGSAQTAWLKEALAPTPRVHDPGDAPAALQLRRRAR